MKNRKVISWIIVGLFFTGVYAGGTALGSTAAPGTASDPLVSQSYVDNKFNQLYNMVQGGGNAGAAGASKDVIIAEIMAQLSLTSSSAFKPVQLTYNQVIIGDEGAEIILRSGTAVGYCGGSNGLADVTDGSEVTNGVAISQNHHLLISRGDGRGAKVTSGDAWFLIKGGYKILG